MAGMTIAKLAKAADVGVETVRYYQRRGLMPVPRAGGRTAFRHYDEGHLQRLRFIRRAQAAGFTLDDIKELSTPGRLLAGCALRAVLPLGTLRAYDSLGSAHSGFTDRSTLADFPPSTDRTRRSSRTRRAWNPSQPTITTPAFRHRNQPLSSESHNFFNRPDMVDNPGFHRGVTRNI